MKDAEIIDLYWERSEFAVEETQKKYGGYCRCIAYRILRSDADADECVNDTYLNAWNAMPPQRPVYLKAFLGTITRNLALNRYSYNNAEKRSAQTDIIADELFECIPDGGLAEENSALRDAINSFLASLNKNIRIVFMRRYWYMCSVKEIADSMHMTESNVKVTLHRVRKKFKAYLEKEGIAV